MSYAQRLRAATVLGALLVTAACAVARADLAVVTTGDSLTVGYGLDRLQSSFDAVSYEATVQSVASGGCNIRRYLGLVEDPHTGTYRDMAGEVLAMDPDVILFMLGTNDASSWYNWPGAFDAYTSGMATVLDRFAAATNGRGQTPIVILSTLIPILRDADQPGTQYYEAGLHVVNDFNPWITAQAEARGLVLMDSYGWITGHEDWQDYYNDGVHLYANSGEGFDVLAEGFRDATIAAVPEPATVALLCAGLLVVRRRHRRR